MRMCMHAHWHTHIDVPLKLICLSLFLVSVAVHHQGTWWILLSWKNPLLCISIISTDPLPVRLTGFVNRAMAGPELLLDSSIRLWVVLPIVFITFFVGIIRHYVTQLLHSDKKIDLEQMSDRWEPLASLVLCVCECVASCLNSLLLSG